ncbi:MAG TPA: FAD-dependent oxidoreductase, partial [Treponemataceae bacterium]|nr:FAD-dependent oxidoreductase [Treponemataceae bacterium]
MTTEKETIYDEKNKINWDEIHDVIIIGAGFAGLSAAIEAAQAGAKVLVLEKMASYGGNSIISDGGIAAPDTDLQKKQKIKDSPQLMYQDMIQAGLGLNNQNLVKTVCERAKDAFNWTQCLGVKYLDRVDIFGGHSLPRCYTAKNITGATIIKKQIKKLKECGVPLRYKSYVQKFIVNKEGRVIGVSTKKN